jgi:hypothetical protein
MQLLDVAIEYTWLYGFSFLTFFRKYVAFNTQNDHEIKMSGYRFPDSQYSHKWTRTYHYQNLILYGHSYILLDENLCEFQPIGSLRQF